MKKSAYILQLLFVLVVAVSCKKETTVQTYLIAKQENPKFTTLDLSTSVLPFTLKSNASQADKDAYNSIRKVNIAFLSKAKATDDEIKAEVEMLKTILDTSDYKMLVKVKKSGIDFKVYYKGDTEAIDEMIVVAYAQEMGMGIARLLGEDMNPNALMTMTQSIDINLDTVMKLKSTIEGEN